MPHPNNINALMDDVTWKDLIQRCDFVFSQQHNFVHECGDMKCDELF